jgi:hypothetical protein
VAIGSLGLLLLLHNPPIDHQPWAIEFGPLVWTVCLAALFAMLVRNFASDRAFRGPWLVAALGAGLNLLVVAANGGYMPQSAEARIAVRGTPIMTTGESKLWNVQPIDEATHLPILGDVIAEPRWLPGANVISVGDLLLGAGLTWWAISVTRRKRTD